jgi:putative ABC transport system ATP-binding protein
MPVLTANDLYRFYHAGEDETLALRGVSLAVQAKEMVAVMGPSGSGKSTLLACLAGLDEPDGGYVQVLEHRLTRRPETERSALRAQYIGIMLQIDNLFETLTVEENLLLSMRLAGKVDRRRLDYLLDFIGLSDRRKELPSHLSGGEEARIALAVALAADPAVLLLDEPTGEVDGETELRIMELISQYCRSGGAAVLVTHSDALARQANRTIRLLDGQVTDND